MYRLPNQFDPAPRNGSVSAAGGGSTSTTCSSCIVTLAAASIVPAVLFTRQPTTLPGLNGIDGIDDVVRGGEPTIAPLNAHLAAARDDTAQPTHHIDLTAPPAYRPPPTVVEPLTPGLRLAFGVLGFFTFPLSAGLTLLLIDQLGVGLAIVLGVAMLLVIFAKVYGRTRGNANSGLVAGAIVTVLALALGFGEMMLWIQGM